MHLRYLVKKFFVEFLIRLIRSLFYFICKQSDCRVGGKKKPQVNRIPARSLWIADNTLPSWFIYPKKVL